MKNEKIQEKFSCLGICLSVTMVVRLSRNCATQILNFVSCSDWFSRNYHAPATRQKILPSPSGNKCHTGLHAGYHLTLLATTNHVNVYMSIKRFSLRQGREFPSLFFSLCFLAAIFISAKMKRLRENNDSGKPIVKKKGKLSLLFPGLFIAVVRKIFSVTLTAHGS